MSILCQKIRRTGSRFRWIIKCEEAVNIAESLEWVDESSIEASEGESQLAA
ncbi:MAG: hypothetical protein SPJ45_05690 [Anaerovoracaceae bacterium]|nr:hypothetical protein [Bacillota bacterium]MDD7733379.1 hypothetical protein [Bacillota bacterium]MDY5906351.1 hypothetical protein [Anaerovoracaceae bacterium]